MPTGARPAGCPDTGRRRPVGFLRSRNRDALRLGPKLQSDAFEDQDRTDAAQRAPLVVDVVVSILTGVAVFAALTLLFMRDRLRLFLSYARPAPEVSA